MQALVGVAGYSATVKGVATRKSLGTTALYKCIDTIQYNIHCNNNQQSEGDSRKYNALASVYLGFITLHIGHSVPSMVIT